MIGDNYGVDAMGGEKRLTALIQDVIENSIACEVGIEPGDTLLTVNGQTICDILDYQFAVQDTAVELAICKANGQTWLVDIEKDEDDELGLIFAGAIFDNMRVCKNRCLFCFVDQLPFGLRSTLQVKDDDYRHSFLFGNFITMTNLKPEDWDKILAMRLSPLYISVHAMNPRVRVNMLKHKKSGTIKEDLGRLYQAGIQIHTQIVLCPVINDGDVLEDTIQQLAEFYPSVQSIGIVPVGLTRHRQRLPLLRPCNPEQSADLITRVGEYQRHFRQQLGLGVVYLADEFYLQAGQAIPHSDYYDGFEQLENGIGLIRRLWDEFTQLKDHLPAAIPPRQVHIITGVSGAIALDPICERLNQIAGLSVQTIPVVNHFLGETVTVTGLLTGQDIITTLGSKYRGKQLLLPEVLLKAGEALLLDDSSVAEIEAAAGAEIKVVPIEARALVNAVLNTKLNENGELNHV
jgi:putative radical SAM enzyme (TIGR03279 family)